MLAPVAASAQVNVESNLLVASAYVWRGVTTTNRAVVQPDVAFTVPIGGRSLTLGSWASIEPARYDGANDISAVYGQLPGPAFTEFSAWLSHDVEWRGIAISTGVDASIYPAIADLASYNTVEFSATATMPAPLAPTFSIWYDVGAVRGAYVEAMFGLDREIGPTQVNVSVVGGVNIGQGPDPNAYAYFARRSLTHVELVASASQEIGALRVAPTLHVIRSVDANTMVIAPGVTRTVKVWLGTTLT